MTRLRTLGDVKCSEGDEQYLLQFVNALRKDKIGTLLVRHGLSRAGTKEEMCDRITKALAQQSLTASDLIHFLDEVVPWGKQHVYLLAGPNISITDWRDQNWLQRHLAKNKVKKYLNGVMPIALPNHLTLSSIQHDTNRLRVVAVHRKIHRERRPDQDDRRVDDEGRTVELDAYERTVTRGLVIFEWDLISNTAMLQITQLHSEGDYERIAKAFRELVNRWLTLDNFPRLDVRRAIAALYEAEGTSKGETRSQNIGFRTLQGRTLLGKSASRQDPIRGETIIDRVQLFWSDDISPNHA